MEYADIVLRFERLLDAGKISEYIKCTVMDMSNKVLEHIARKYENVREGVKSVMGGKVLERDSCPGEADGRGILGKMRSYNSSFTAK